MFREELDEDFEMSQVPGIVVIVPEIGENFGVFIFEGQVETVAFEWAGILDVTVVLLVGAGGAGCVFYVHWVHLNQILEDLGLVEYDRVVDRVVGILLDFIIVF